MDTKRVFHLNRYTKQMNYSGFERVYENFDQIASIENQLKKV